MSDDTADCPKCPPPGAPGWMGTFADLMSLLMCFFVLLLSFAEMDAMKFKRLAGSMAQAFGVQNKIEMKDPPKGTSIIAQEFSPGRPEPTPINEIYQHTDDLTELSLDVSCAEQYDVEAGVEDMEAGVADSTEIAEKIEKLIAETRADAVELATALQQQIVKGEVEIETKGRQIVVRIREKGSFASGSATLVNDYIPLLLEVRDVLATQEGTISVQGHTDSIPMNQNARFRSNLELSGSRSARVAEELLFEGVINPRRISVTGYGDTRPLDTNETAVGRSRNRRVEIVIQQGLDEEMKDSLEILKDENPEYYETLELEDSPVFNLSSDEVF